MSSVAARAWVRVCSGAILRRPPAVTAWWGCTLRRRTSALWGIRSGGIGWYARRFGLQCQAITAVEVVLADGSIVRASAETEPELFWGLRGSGMPLGVVTALEFELFPLETVVAGFLVWDWTLVERVLPAWAEWAVDAPEAATTSFRLVEAPNMNHIPAELRGRRLLVIDGAVLGSDTA